MKPGEVGASAPTPPVVESVVRQHADDAAALYGIRSRLCREPYVKLRHLRELDDRLAAHMHGLRIAGEHAWALCDAAFESPAAGPLFVAAVRAVEERDELRTERLLALAEALPEASDGVLSAFGWLEPPCLQGTVASLLGSPAPFKRMLGIAACAMHGVDPGLATARRFQDPDPFVRGRSFRTAGELGRRELVSACGAVADDPDPRCQFWAAWAAVLLGDRAAALDRLTQAGVTDGPDRMRAFRLMLQATRTSSAHAVLQRLARDPAQLRWLIQGSGVSGDPAYVPWLITHMKDDRTARLAGEAFGLITGTDLALDDLERKPPENFESGPNDDPEDPNIDMDPDEGLPWPDQQKIDNWWAANGARFTKGQRCFMGAPVTRERCIDAIKDGYQRQRILAAHYLCLLEPGTPLFNTSAPAWRQQRLLAQMK